MIYWQENGLLFRDEDGEQSGWRIAALDPHDFTYYEDDACAMDETNWDAMVASFDSDTSLETVDGADAFRGWFRGDVRAVADWGVLPFTSLRSDDDEHDGAPSWVSGRGSWREQAWWEIGTAPNEVGSLVDRNVLVVREGSDAWETWEDIANDLSSYPLLDEDAYLRRDFEAWDKWWFGDGIGELLGKWRPSPIVPELLALGIPEDGWGEDGDESLADALADADTFDVAHAACEGMSYWNGFTGEYDEVGAVDALVNLLTGVWAVMRFLARNGRRVVERAEGVQTLPGIGWRP